MSWHGVGTPGVVTELTRGGNCVTVMGIEGIDMTTTATHTTRVQITLTVEVPIDEWADTYGTARTARDVQRDVRDYVRNAVQEGQVPMRVVR